MHVCRTRTTSVSVFFWYICFTLLDNANVEAGRLRRESQNPVDDAQVVSVRKGGDAVLRCDVIYPGDKREPPPYVIEWFKSGLPIFIKVGKHPAHVNHDFEGRMAIVGDSITNASLQIFNLTESDDGWYECRVLFLREKFETSANGTWVKLDVTDPPKFLLIPPQSVESRQGQSLLLKCRATGRPQPVITWRKDGWLVKDGQNGIRLSGGDLAVTSLGTSHRGKYTCRAQSVEGQVQASTRVQVEAPPEFTIKPSNTTSEEGQDAMFSCKATGYPPYMKYSWSYNGILVKKSPVLRGRYSALEDGTLIIYHVNTKDKGIVTCKVDNGFGISPSASAALYVQFKARVSQMPALIYAGIGLKAVLTCPSEAEPPVNKVVWRKGGLQISPHQDPRISMNGNGSLIIVSASPRDAGRYTCTPFNMLGTLGESTASRLIIRDPPYFTQAPNPTYEFEIGKSAKIPCKGGGDPPPAVTWRKVLNNGETLQYLVESGNLTIPSVVKTDHGIWQCVLVNSVAEVTTSVQILVKYTSPHQVTNVTAQALSNTAVRVSWTPGYNGGHRQHFMLWYKQAEKGDHSWQTLQIEGMHKVAVVENLEPNTAYEFAVLPENKLHSGPFSATVVTNTLAVRPPVRPKTAGILSPPQALFASKTSEGYVQLSWRKPYSAKHGRRKTLGRSEVAPSPYASGMKILGFLIEYRWTGEDLVSGSQEEKTEPGASASRSKRYATLLKRQKRDAAGSPGREFAGRLLQEEYTIPSRSKRDVDPEMPEKNTWDTLATTYDNITTVVMKPGKLYRDLKYEFRVLTVSENEYSAPSNPVSVSTKGLLAYPCYTGVLNSAALFGHPVVAGVLTAICLMALLVIILIICFCRKRKQRRRMKNGFKSGKETTDDMVLPNTNHINDPLNKTKMNGNASGANHPIVVDLTNGGPGGYGIMDKREYMSPSSDDDIKSPFMIESNDTGDSERERILSSFSSRQGEDSEDNLLNAKEMVGSMSDRSSVRMRRETAVRILSQQLKRRSLTEHTRYNMRREIPSRGGIRSASTSPERTDFSFARPDRLNVTSPPALEASKPRRKIRLYSRPIDDAGSSQQRRMIVIKRKSQKSSSSEASRRISSSRPPPSDSSESPVFGVIGTINQTPDNRTQVSSDKAGSNYFIKPESSCSSKEARSNFQKNSRGIRLRDLFSPTHRSPLDDEVFRHGNDVTNSKSDDDVVREVNPWDSPLSPPILSSSPKDVMTSPIEVSPNRVVARHTVAYDPAKDPCNSPRGYGEPGSSPEMGTRWVYNDSNSKFVRTRGENSRTSYAHSPHMVNTQREGFSPHPVSGHGRFTPRVPTVASYQNVPYKPHYKRLSLSQNPVTHTNNLQSQQYQQQATPSRTGVPHKARTRASYTFGHKPLALSPAPKDINLSTPQNIPTSSPSSNPPQSTLEIDCSNSDIEVRFVKDPNGNGYLQQPRDIRSPLGIVTSYREAGSGEILNRIKSNRISHSTQASTRMPKTGPGRSQAETDAPTPSSGNSAQDLRYNLRNMSTSTRQGADSQQHGSHSKSTFQSRVKSPEQSWNLPEIEAETTANAGVESPKDRPRYLVSPSRLNVSSPMRHLKLKSSSDPPTSPPLAGIGSSDYGSQDTSNSSTSPMVQSSNAQNTTSPLHSRALGLTHERPPRRDNSSVEDNYEWDSEIAMESEILEALRHFGTLKKTGPVSDELLDELNKITKDTKEFATQQRPHSVDVLEAQPIEDSEEEEEEDADETIKPKSPEPNYSKESMARRCAALRAEFLHYQKLQQLDEDEMT